MEVTSLPTQITFDTMASSEQHTFLKMEDLDNNSPQITVHTERTEGTPSAVFVHSKAAKKRKSWGQALPEVDAGLPPRKRAKTDEEKEQRRIERIKRNRAAAHNSRERKRQETETLAVQLARVNAEIEAYRKLYGPLPSNIVLPEVTLITDSADTPAPSLVESRSSFDPSSTPETINDDLFDDNTISIKQEPIETYPTAFPPSFEGIDSKASLPLFDLTQHSAAMLCDLQCRSISNRASTQWWAAFLLYMTTLQLQTTYKCLAMTFWTLFPSRTTTRLARASMLPSTSRSTTSSTTPLRSLSTVALAQRNAATATDRVRRSASALVRRRFWMQARLRAKAREVAAKRVRQAQTVSDTMAFTEEGRTSDMGIGESDGGVGR